MQNPLLGDRSFAHVRKTDLIVSIAPPTPSLSGMLSCVAKKLGGNVVWLFLLVALMFSLSYSPQAKAQIETCNDDLCAGVAWQPYVIHLIHPSFPSCSVDVHYNRKKCPPPINKWMFKLINIELKNSTAIPNPCVGLQAWLDADDAHYQQLFEWASEKIGASLFIFEHPNYLTDPNVWCPNGTVITETYFAGCNHYCIYEDTRSITSGGTGLNYIVPMDCGAFGKCCKATIITCYDPVLQTTYTYTTKQTIGYGTVCPPILSEICPNYFTIQNSVTTGGTYDLPFTKSTTGCLLNSCDQ